MVEPTKTQHYTYTTHILKNWHPHPTSHVCPVFPPYLRKPSDSCNSWFCSMVFAKACSNEPCGDSSPPCDKGSEEPQKTWVFTTSLSTSDGSVKIMISGENQLPFWKKMENFPLDTTWQKRSNQWLGSNRNDTATVTSNNNDDEDHKNIDNGTPKQL